MKHYLWNELLRLSRRTKIILILLWELKNKRSAGVDAVTVLIMRKKIQTAYFPLVEVCWVTRKILWISFVRKADAHAGGYVICESVCFLSTYT